MAGRLAVPGVPVHRSFSDKQAAGPFDKHVLMFFFAANGTHEPAGLLAQPNPTVQPTSLLIFTWLFDLLSCGHQDRVAQQEPAAP